MQYFEDLVIGTRHAFGSYEVTRDEVVEFARRYDPQGFHLSDEEAARTHFGRLSASGWHTCAMMMSMLVEHLHQHQHASLGSPGVDELRWLKPVYPGDTLRCESELIEKRRSQSRPEMGSTRMKIVVFNQDDQPVLSMTSIALVRVRGD